MKIYFTHHSCNPILYLRESLECYNILSPPPAASQAQILLRDSLKHYSFKQETILYWIYIAYCTVIV
ncbi:MAG: hypothetical protein BWY38_00445 [Ignavibacteria bacterium ADurb.Bin266]|nr:MAG: hypothetical protein BWY38_00445 [Ignavibacteria bacterium ADurb.Bin266]